MLQPVPARWRRFALAALLIVFTVAALYESHRHYGLSPRLAASLLWSSDSKSQESYTPNSPPSNSPSASPSSSPSSSAEVYLPPAPPRVVYKDAEHRPLANRPFVRIGETFPIAAGAKSPKGLPPVPPWNAPPIAHVTEVTPLFIGFTRNWLLLQQTVVSFLTAGWPPEDIYVVENTGVMDANQQGRLGLQNPFYLDYQRLTKVFGVHVITTPSLQTFAQLQNFFFYEAIRNNWPHYFWSHMDILVQSSEDKEPYKSFYLKCVDAIRQTLRKQNAAKRPWALKFFAYDWVTLMNTAALVELGGWDTMITYYTADCDMYDRMRMANMSTDTADAGPVYDTGESFEDLAILYRAGDQRRSKTWEHLQEIGRNMTHFKNTGGERQRWQWQQMGGQDEPYYRDIDGFQEAVEYNVQAGISVFEAKWGSTGCSLLDKGLKIGDEWLVERIEGA
jgi:hypothetical protein